MHISGSKTDWLNQGRSRAHTKVSDSSPTSDICVGREVVSLFAEFPAKFSRNRDLPVAGWGNSTPILPSAVTAFLRVDVGKGVISLRNIPALTEGRGATALYRAAREIDLVARFGRWRSRSISVYLWGAASFTRASAPQWRPEGKCFTIPNGQGWKYSLAPRNGQEKQCFAPLVCFSEIKECRDGGIITRLKNDVF